MSGKTNRAENKEPTTSNNFITAMIRPQQQSGTIPLLVSLTVSQFIAFTQRNIQNKSIASVHSKKKRVLSDN